jgi:hypothetical protein
MTDTPEDELQKLRGNLFAIELLLARLCAERAAQSPRPEEALAALLRLPETTALSADVDLRHDAILTKAALDSIGSVHRLAEGFLPHTLR